MSPVRCFLLPLFLLRGLLFLRFSLSFFLLLLPSLPLSFLFFLEIPLFLGLRLFQRRHDPLCSDAWASEAWASGLRPNESWKHCLGEEGREPTRHGLNAGDAKARDQRGLY